MRNMAIGCLAAILCSLSLVATTEPAMAQTARAYILIETAPDKINTVRQRLGSLGNCLALAETLIQPEVVAHLECNDLRSLHEVITNEIASIEGVSRVTTWLTISRR